MKRLLRLLTLLVLFSTIVVVCTAATETVVLQPGPDTGKDKGAYDSDIVPYYTFPYTQFTVLAYTNCNNANANGYLQFDLTGLPTENILNAEIQTYTQVFYNGDGGSWYIDPLGTRPRLVGIINHLMIRRYWIPMRSILWVEDPGVTLIMNTMVGSRMM